MMKSYFYHHDHLKRYLSSKMAFFVAAAVGLAVLFVISIASSSASTNLNSFEMEAEGSYSLLGGDTKTLAQSLAVFAAKRSAVQTAARFFSQKELIELFGKKRLEIINITADNLTSATLQENWPRMDNQTICSVRIKLVIKPSDFIEAQIENLQLEKKVSAQSYREEMEPVISNELLPGHDIAEAYRLIRIQSLRTAVIYLDRLQQKYPNWPVIFEVKALVFYLQHQPKKMEAALQKACELGSQSGCSDLKMFTRSKDQP
ncbi:MAG: hypothetical protein PVJ00_07935 [Desulfobacterales bacterium]